jgi:DnaK suppressor protein
MKAPIEIPKRSDLSGRRAALQAKLAELTGVFRDRSELAIENSPDMLDAIQMTVNRDLLVERMNMCARTLSDVRAALQKLDNGAYGICEDCDETIGPRRLDAIPWAQVCVKCQEDRDSRRGDEREDVLLAA